MPALDLVLGQGVNAGEVLRLGRLGKADLVLLQTQVDTYVAAHNSTTTTVQTQINTWLAANVTEFQAVCHVYALAPLDVAWLFLNPGETIPANWWVRG